jgi:hypothetical protein
VIKRFISNSRSSRVNTFRVIPAIGTLLKNNRHAIIVHETGEPSVLKYEQVLTPTPSTGDVLIKVYASGVNPADTHVRSGFRALPEGLRPVVKLPYTPGSDLGTVITLMPDTMIRQQQKDSLMTGKISLQVV